MNSRKYIIYYALLLSSLYWSVPGHAEDDESAEHGKEAKNEIAVFVGLTHEGRRDNSAALGLEYERRLNEKFGVGALAEFTAGDADFWVYAIPLTLHVKRWKFVLAPGVEYNDGHTEKLIRLGTGYEFEPGSMKITPTFAVDFVGGDAVIIAGVTFGLVSF